MAEALTESITEVLKGKQEQLFFYSPFNFIRSIDKNLQINHYVNNKILNFSESTNNYTFEVYIEGYPFWFFYTYLPWDSNYFNLPTYKLFLVLHNDNSLARLSEAVKSFKNHLFSGEKKYCFIDIPSEDILLIQALCNNNFRIVETRLNLSQGNLDNFNEPRYNVRSANLSDIDNLKRVASEMRNDYDRFHADPVFSPQKADDFLATYIEQAVKGFCDVVLVPDESGLPSDSFVAGSYHKQDSEILNCKIARMVVSAVSSKTNKGWYRKIITELTYHLRDIGTDVIFMNTQSTNRAVIHTLQSLGYRIGSVTHIISYNN